MNRFVKQIVESDLVNEETKKERVCTCQYCGRQFPSIKGADGIEMLIALMGCCPECEKK